MTRDSYITILVEVHEPYFSRKHIFHELYRINRTQDYGLKICKQVPDYSTLR